MNQSINISDFYSICRVCLESKDNMFYANVDIIQMLEACTSVQESNDKLPQQICKICYNLLKNSYDFRQKYYFSLQILSKILENNNKTDTRSEIKKETVDIKCNILDNYSTTVVNFEDIKFDEQQSVISSSTDETDNENIEPTTNENTRKIKKKRPRLSKEDQDVYICDLCGRKFSKQSYLKVHKISHSNEKPFKCKICDNTFKYSFTLTTHMKTQHTEPERREMCFICGKFIIPQSLSYHLSTHRENKEKFKCKVCNKEYTQQGILRKHIQEKHSEAANTKVFCEICNKGYASKDSLKIHKAYVHTEGKNLSCPICGKKFKMMFNVNAHINATHKDLRPHSCNICKKAFHTRTLLKKHMICHTGERPYACTICGKAFGTKTVLTTHMKVHSK